MVDNSIQNFDVNLIFALAKIIVDENISETVRVLRFEALVITNSYLLHYREHGYTPELIDKIAEKKCEMILKATTKTEMERIIHPRCPHYNGNEFVPDEYSIPEEELIAWSEASLRAPLNNAGVKRYISLFKEIFPDIEIPNI